MRDPYRIKPSWKFRLFGEWKIFYWIFGGIALLTVAFWGTIGYVAVHFIRKGW